MTAAATPPTTLDRLASIDPPRVWSARSSAATVQIQIARVCLEIVTDHPQLIDDLEAIYGDCGLVVRLGGGPTIRCAVRRIPSSTLLHLSFEGRHLPDSVDVALSIFRPLRHRQCYQETEIREDGLRQLVNTEDDDHVLLASRANMVILDLDEAPPEFLLDLLITTAQAAQVGVLFLHAASVAVHGSGALIIGAGHAGKSTTALALTALGHHFLADDASAVCLATREALPFPKSAGVRDEALAGELGWPVRQARHRIENFNTGPRLSVRVSDLFPGSLGTPVPLQHAFVLDGFAQRTTIRPFEPGLRELPRLRCLAAEITACWGSSVGRHLMKYLTAINLMSTLQCHIIELGPPLEAAQAIVESMEEP